MFYHYICLLSNTIFIGKVYCCFDDLQSTNDYALKILDFQPNSEKGEAREAGAAPIPNSGSIKDIAKNRPVEGMVIRAVSQSAGRGQFGSHWESAAGLNLTFSVILYPIWLSATAQFYLSMAVALAVRDTLCFFRDQAGGQAMHIPVTLKWPNDVYLGTRKCAGILIQNALAGNQLQSSVVGIGLNVHQMQFSSLAPNPVSMAMAFGQTFDLEKVMEYSWIRLEQRYLQLKAGGGAALRALYESHLYRRGENTRFQRTADGSTFAGQIMGVTESGRLRIRTIIGEETFELKEIKITS